MNRYFESKIVEERGSVLSLNSKPVKTIWTRVMNVVLESDIGCLHKSD